MLPRVLEPEIMDTAEEADDYDSMDHSEVNRRFVIDWATASRTWGLDVHAPRRMLDIGTGTALIPIEFCRQFPNLQIVAIDLASEMLRLGARNIRLAGLESRIQLRLVDAKGLTDPDCAYESVASNSILHHIPEPFLCLAEMARILAPGGFLFVRDLMRPSTSAEVESIVKTYAQGATMRQQQLFRQSLHAALTIEEVAGLLERIGLPRQWVQATSDRHWTIAGRR